MNRSIVILLILLTTACSKSNQSTEQSTDPPSKLEFRVTKKYNPDEIKSFDSATLRLKRNEIFAQYGYIFKSPELLEHFQKKQWYKPVNSNVDSLLTELDKQNINLLLEREAVLKKIRDFDCGQTTNELSEFAFNSSIKSVIDSLGFPYKTFIDPDEYCPIGQLHYWKIDQKEFDLIILGDSYDDTANFEAKSRVYAIQTTNKFGTLTEGFSGILLGEDASVVELKLNCLVQSNPGFTLSKVDGTSAVERFLIDQQNDLFVLTNKKIYIHFSINLFDRLDYIFFSNFNVRIAC